jgi:hypothetical protein
VTADDDEIYWAGTDHVGRAAADGTGASRTYRTGVSVFGVQILPPLAVASGSTVDFGETAAGTTAERSFSIRNDSTAPLRTKGITVTGDDFTVTRETCTQAPVRRGGTCEVTARFAPAKTGPHAGTVSLRTNGKPVEVKLTGTASPAEQPSQVAPPAPAAQRMTAPSLAPALVKVVVCRKGVKRCKTVTMAALRGTTITASLKRGGKTQSKVTRKLTTTTARIVLRTARKGKHSLTLTVRGAKKPLVTRSVRVG